MSHAATNSQASSSTVMMNNFVGIGSESGDSATSLTMDEQTRAISPFQTSIKHTKTIEIELPPPKNLKE